eukprot:10068561-Prorocentrum_lima.AAC.1
MRDCSRTGFAEAIAGECAKGPVGGDGCVFARVTPGMVVVFQGRSAETVSAFVVPAVVRLP